MIENFRYKLNTDGNVSMCGIEAFDSEIIATDEPFGWDAIDWQLVNGEWVNTKLDYKYIIIPADIIPDITQGTANVQSIDMQDAFNVVCETMGVTDLNGNTTKVVTSSILMIPCKIIEFTEADAAQVDGIIGLWNSIKTPIIDFDCHFENEQKLNEFKQLQLI